MNEDRIGVFGSAFNPPHMGHADVLAQAVKSFDTLVVVPSYKHAFGKNMMPYAFRLEMTQALVADIQLERNVVVSDVEQLIAAGQNDDYPIYTYHVLRQLETEFGHGRLTFIVGPDNADPATWKRFYRSDDILNRWGIWAAEERLHVRSTLIRNKLQAGEIISNVECPPSVISLLTSSAERF